MRPDAPRCAPMRPYGEPPGSCDVLLSARLQSVSLSEQGTSTLSREELIEACLDRGFGSARNSDAQLRHGLGEWLSLVQSDATAQKGSAELRAFEPHRLRLSVMAACAVSSARQEREALSVLPRLLYAP